MGQIDRDYAVIVEDGQLAELRAVLAGDVLVPPIPATTPPASPSTRSSTVVPRS